MSNKVSPALEDYLETIYMLHKRSGSVRVTDVAAEMSISKPSVNKAVNILKDQGYVEHEHYGPLSLTTEGIRIARSVAARHQALVRLLHDVLGVSIETAEKDSCRIEHVISMETVCKIIAYLATVAPPKGSVKEPASE